MYWIYSLAGVNHLTKFDENWPITHCMRYVQHRVKYRIWGDPLEVIKVWC